MMGDLRFALRMIVSHRWFSLAVVVTLALGIGLNTMVFTLVNAALMKPVPVPGGARLVSIESRHLSQKDNFDPLSYPDFQDFSTQSSSFEAMEGAIDDDQVLSENGTPPQSYHVQQATAGIFTMLHTNPIVGRGFVASDTKPGADPVLVIGYGVWKDRYASSAGVIGRQVRVNGQPATIIGVMPEGYRFPNGVDLWMPLVPTPELMKRDNRRIRAYGILKPSVSIEKVSNELDGIAGRLASQFPEDKDLGASVETFHQRYNGGNIRIIFLMMLAAVGFVLLIACADVANMMLSRALARKREMSIRTALGATRWRMMRQLLMESVLLSVLGGLVGLALAVLGVRWFDAATLDIRPSWIAFSMDYAVFGYFAGLCIVSGLLFGTAPALRASRVDLNEVLKEGTRSVAHREGWLSAVLVVFQFALSLVLLTGAGIFARGLVSSLTANPDIPARALTIARVDLPDARYKDADSRMRFYDELLARLGAIPGVRHAAMVSSAPGLDAAQEQIELEHAPVADPKHRPSVSFVAQSPGYLEAIHLRLSEGRDFNAMDGGPQRGAAIVTRDAAAHFWPGQDPLGKRFRLYDDQNKPTEWLTVVGVSANMVQQMFADDPRPLIFLPYRQEGWNSMCLMVEASGDPSSAIRAAVQKQDVELPVRDVSTLNAALEHRTWFLRVFGKIFGSFALIGLVMAAVGIYAVIAHASNRRTQEIGVRMALGASVHNILILMMKRGLWQIGAGLVLGLGLAIPGARLLRSALMGVLAADPMVFVVVAAVLASVGVFACWLPARRAAALDPVKAIRYE